MSKKRVKQLLSLNVDDILNKIILVNTVNKQRIKLQNENIFTNKNITGKTHCKQFILKDNSISNPHCRIFRIANVYYIEDLKSLNGTFINGSKINKITFIRPNDTIEIGNTKFLICKTQEALYRTLKNINNQYLSYALAKEAIIDAFTIDYLSNAIMLNKGELANISRFCSMNQRGLESRITKYKLWGLVEEAKALNRKVEYELADDNINDLITKLIKK